jgi:hypothetical protein
MRLEFRPEFKALWPRLKDAFKGLRFRAAGYRRMMRLVLALLGCVCLTILALLAIIRPK